MQTIGSIIRKKRKAKGWTLEQLASQLGVDFSSISAWERDQRTPSVFILLDLADIFECSLDELCGRK